MFDTLRGISGAANPRLSAWLQDELLQYFYCDDLLNEQDSDKRRDLEAKSHLFDRAALITDSVVELQTLCKRTPRDFDAEMALLRSRGKSMSDALTSIYEGFKCHWSLNVLRATWSGRTETDMLYTTLGALDRLNKILSICQLWVALMN